MTRNTRGTSRRDQLGAGRTHAERRAIAARRAALAMANEQTAAAPVNAGR